MTDAGPFTSRRRLRSQATGHEVSYGLAPSKVHPSIASMRGAHRAAHPDMGIILEAASHLQMVAEWPIQCPRFMEALRDLGMECVSRLQYIKLDHHLLTALVERWSPQTNTFHLPVGEMTITLQDVGMILGVQLDGPPLIGRIVVGEGKRWHTWLDLCDDLIGQHPIEDTVYYDPFNPQVSSTFRIGQAHAKTCLPLRWLRWTFYRDSYLTLTELDFRRHTRAYILFMIGCFLMPDASGSEVHLQYLTLLEDLELFSTFSLGGAVLAHLYRELHEFTKPRCVNMGGCLFLLQVWSWEHLHVGRPTLHIPYPRELEGLSVGVRWNERHIREMSSSNVRVYRDMLDGLLQSQVIWEPYGMDIRARVAYLCISGIDIWRARVPMISWKRVEWHLPDRVIRQFGALPRTDMALMDPTFRRVDGRGKTKIDCVDYHQSYITLWEHRRAYVVEFEDQDEDQPIAINSYMRWYRSWASLYLLKASTEAPGTYYPRTLRERYLLEYCLRVEEIFQPFFGRQDDTPVQHAVDTFEKLCSGLRRKMYISYDLLQDVIIESVQEKDQSPLTYEDPGVGPSTYVDPGSLTYQWSRL